MPEETVKPAVGEPTEPVVEQQEELAVEQPAEPMAEPKTEASAESTPDAAAETDKSDSDAVADIPAGQATDIQVPVELAQAAAQGTEESDVATELADRVEAALQATVKEKEDEAGERVAAVLAPASPPVDEVRRVLRLNLPPKCRLMRR